MAGLVPAIYVLAFAVEQSMDQLTDLEQNFCSTILRKQNNLHKFIASNQIENIDFDPAAWFRFLTGIKNVLGNINNDVAFVATLLIKKYLNRRFSIIDFDAGAKAQGAPGIDIEAKTPDGKSIVGELKNTKPYQPGFGAAQRTSILKDMNRLETTHADYKFMFVTDIDAFAILTSGRFKRDFQTVEIVNLVAIAE